MTQDELAQKLHDRATRGLAISSEEKALLEQWYAVQDQEESAGLARTASPQGLATLRAQVDSAVAQLVTVTQRIQALAAENESVRRDIAVLQRHLVQKQTTQTA